MAVKKSQTENEDKEEKEFKRVLKNMLNTPPKKKKATKKKAKKKTG